MLKIRNLPVNVSHQDCAVLVDDFEEVVDEIDSSHNILVVEIQKAEHVQRRRTHRCENIGFQSSLDLFHEYCQAEAGAKSIVGIHIHQDLLEVNWNDAVVEVPSWICHAEVDFVLLHPLVHELELVQEGEPIFQSPIGGKMLIAAKERSMLRLPLEH